jgi:FkbM family methyltransferase
VRRTLKSAIKALGRRAGVDIQRYAPQHSAEHMRGCILAHEDISLVLDVGANVGQHATRLRRAGYRGRIVSFEPQARAFAQLARAAAQDPLWECRQIALGDEDGISEIRIAEESVVSSLLTLEPTLARTAGWATVGTQSTTEARLDPLADQIIGRNDRTCLKLDVQGYEMHVLLGAAKTLERISVVEAELNLIPLYEGQADLSEMLGFFESAGFRLACLHSGDFVEGPAQMVFADGIFVRRDVVPGLDRALAWRAPQSRGVRRRALMR